MMTDRIKVEVEEIRLQDYRAFENARLRLSDLTFLVGRNGAGKSSILDAVDLVREAVTDSLTNALDRRGVEQSGEFRFGVAIQLLLRFSGGRVARAIYGIGLYKAPDDAHPLLNECLGVLPRTTRSFARVGAELSGWGEPLPPDLAGLSPPPEGLILPLVANLDNLWALVLDTLRQMRAYELSPTLMARAPEIGQGTALIRDGANAGDVLRPIQDTTDHEWIVRHLAAITEGVTSVRAEALLGRRVVQFTRQQGGDARVYDASQMSQGTLRALGVLLALRQRPVPSLVLVAEIENSLHPGALNVLVDAALGSADRTRVVLTSHSPELLSHPAVTGDRVRYCSWRDGRSGLFRLNEATRHAINEIDTVGWLLRSNALWINDEPETFPYSPDARSETVSGGLFDLEPPTP
jgi:predicted ATPase